MSVRRLERLVCAERQRHPLYLPFYSLLLGDRLTEVGLEVELLPGTGGPAGAIRGAVELYVGGPMRTMQMAERGEEVPLAIATIVAACPWVLLARADGDAPVPPVDEVTGTIVDYPEAHTPHLLLDALLRSTGAPSPEFVAPEDTPEAVATFLAGRGDLLLQDAWVAESLGDRARVRMRLMDRIARIPFSSIAANPWIVRERPDLVERVLAAYRAALGDFLTLAREDRAGLEDLYRRVFGDLHVARGASVVAEMALSGLWPEDIIPTVAEYERFADLLATAGWLEGSLDVSAAMAHV